MSELKAYQVDAFLQSQPTAPGIYLIYGSDAGLVHERSILLCNSQFGNTGNNQTLHGDVIVLEMNELEAEPSILAVKALTKSMFAETPVIRIRNASKNILPILTELLTQPFEAVIVVETGSLTKRDKLRVLIEEAPNGWTLPSFADDDRSLAKVIKAAFEKEQILISPDAIAHLCTILGNDREITRRELEKLINFASQSKELSLADVHALCDDNAMVALDTLVDAIGVGNAALLEASLNRSFSAGLDAQLLLNASARHFHFLRTVRQKIDNGSNAARALENTYPKPHFSRKQQISNQVQRWSAPALKRASKRIFDATLESREQRLLGETLTRRALLAICLAAGKL